MKNDSENGIELPTESLYHKECDVMRTKRKRPTSNVRFYTFLVSVVVVIWLFGFIIGRFSVAANNQPCPTVSAQEVDSEEALTDTEPVYEWLDFKATAYCSCSVCCNGWAYNRPVDKYGNEIVLTASGERAVEGVTIAADWSVLPKGTEVEIEGYGTYIVHDKGGSIKGNRIDIYFSNHQAAKQFGVQYVKLRIVK
jgi:3D (Asp-Asp-Asp) domain-containing protein